jgi:hypothetical protein
MAILVLEDLYETKDLIEIQDRAELFTLRPSCSPPGPVLMISCNAIDIIVVASLSP